jgi:hypothetical protein
MDAPRRSWSSAVLAAAAVAAIAWGTLAFGAVYPWAYRPLAAACVVIGIMGIVLERRSGPPIGALAAALAAVAAAASIQLLPLSAETFARVSPAGAAFLRSYDFSYQLAPTAHPLSIAPEKTTLGIALYGALAVFLLGMIRIVSARGAAAVARPLVFFGFALAIFGILQSALLANKDGIVEQIYGFWRPRQGGNPFGPFVNRNHFEGWALMMLPIAVASAVAASERGKKHTRGGGVSWLSTPQGAAMLLVAFAAGIIGLALLMTLSRSGLAAFTGMTLLFGWVIVGRQATKGAKVVAATLIVILFVGATAWAGLGAITNRVSLANRDGSGGRRFEAWSDATRIIRDFPVTGSGLNTFGVAMMVYQSSNRQLHFQEAHNDYLQLASEGGLLLGVPLLLALLIFVRDVRRRFRESPKEGTTYWLRVGATVGLVGIAMQSVLDFSLQMPGNAALFALLAAIALHESPNMRRPDRRSARESR